MLSEAEFCLPLAAAQVQFRERYYGMSAASLLEDLFFDALVYYTRRNDPAAAPIRPPRGEKGYDYTIAGTQISHKVGQRATPIAVLWDATRTMKIWSATNAILYHSYDATGRRRNVTRNGITAPAQALTSPSQKMKSISLMATVWWKPDGDARVLSVDELAPGQEVRESLEFNKTWLVMNADQTIPANEIEILLFSAQAAKKLTIAPDMVVNVSSQARSGLYLLDPDLFTNIQLTRNNRAQLIPGKTVEQAMETAQATERFVPLPTWFSIYTDDNPPSLYLAQKTQYDQFFT